MVGAKERGREREVEGLCGSLGEVRLTKGVGRGKIRRDRRSINDILFVVVAVPLFFFFGVQLFRSRIKPTSY